MLLSGIWLLPFRESMFASQLFLLNRNAAVISDGWDFSHLILDKKVTNLPATSDSLSRFNIFFPVLTLCPTICFFPVYLRLSSLSLAVREKFLTEIQSPRYARLRDWHHDRSARALNIKSWATSSMQRGSRDQPELGRNSYIRPLHDKDDTGQPRDHACIFAVQEKKMDEVKTFKGAINEKLAKKNKQKNIK